jgi:hypothetical protein
MEYSRRIGSVGHMSYGKTEQYLRVCILKYTVGELEGETSLDKRGRIRQDEFKRNFKKCCVMK